MARGVTEKVFEIKHAKLKVFFSLAFRYGIYLAIILWLLISYAYSKEVDSPMVYARNYWLIFLAISVAGIIVKMAQEKNVCVTVLSKTVDITIGDESAVYSVKDYAGTHFNLSKRKKFRHELVFSDESGGQDDFIHVMLPGMKIKQFKDVSDAIMTAKQELEGGNNYVAFEGDVYERNRSASPDIKGALLTILVIAFPVCAIAYSLAWFFSGTRDVGSYVFFMIILSAFYIWLFIRFIRYLLENEPRAKALRSLAFESNGLKINGQQFSYREIESVTMTAPYLMDFSRYHRVLSVKLYDSKKPLRFSLGNRIEKKETEEQLAERCTCTYPELYARIRNDKALERKFIL